MHRTCAKMWNGAYGFAWVFCMHRLAGEGVLCGFFICTGRVGRVYGFCEIFICTGRAAKIKKFTIITGFWSACTHSVPVQPPNWATLTKNQCDCWRGAWGRGLPCLRQLADIVGTHTSSGAQHRPRWPQDGTQWLYKNLTWPQIKPKITPVWL